MKKHSTAPTSFRQVLVLLAAAGLVVTAGVGPADAKGGTAKPPKGAVSPWVVPTLPTPAFSVPAAQLHGFNDTGLAQNATVSNADCPTAARAAQGGTVTLNGVLITIPCNLVVQMPANTLSWAQLFDGTGGSAPLSTTDLELQAVGNIVGTRHIAGLVFISQQSMNGGRGVITALDYANGSMQVANAAGGTVTVQLNDPTIPGLKDSTGAETGRFSIGKSPDNRFSVDQDNPTVHSGTGYPMCVPRTDPSVADDPLCPQKNRPLAPPSPNPAAIPACRNFSTAGVALPVSGELSAPAAGQVYCSQFVMPSTATRTATQPDARQQAPFEVGDFVDFSGTLIRGANGARDYISAHTVEANVGIYTQPGTQPSYLAIGSFGVGTADPLATAVNGVGQETQDRIFLETQTTDVKTPVDIYYEDRITDGPLSGTVRNRWVTPFEMTGENAAPVSGPSGGITTQNAGPQPQRARLRATKAPNGLLSQPDRTVRVGVRSLCMPTPVDPTTTTVNQTALDACFTNAVRWANGLQPGQYVAPVFEFIFPENVKPGDLLVPNDLWHLPFLVNGEGAGNPGALTPAPW
ncbi:hypothetical protein [Pseudarthrobacter sp. H2]|uniref:hypothetical protein n=1 Tax=Pseudarthrobacter sp. H2 TaxID=3418415 RepID=UPI003CEF4D56